MRVSGKLGILFVGLVVVLAGIGVGFAHWSSTVTVTETVRTGDLCVGMADLGTNDAGTANDPGFDQPSDTLVQYDKHVAAAASVNGTFRCTVNEVDYYDSVTFTITNAYPSYAPEETIEFANCGTVPAFLQAFSNTMTVDLNDGSGPQLIDPPYVPWLELLYWELYRNGSPVARGASHPIPGYEYLGAACEPGLVARMMCVQLDPGDTMTVVLCKHPSQEFLPQGDWPDVPQNAVLTITSTATFTQWNLVDNPCASPSED
jgi:hypothetical protein